MKILIFIHGPNGVGKTTLCELLNQKLYNSAWLESEWCKRTNPFDYTDDTIEITINNMTCMLTNYLKCPSIDFVIFNYGFHGPRRKIFDAVMNNISDIEFTYIPITITCNEEENVRRMIKDSRSPERINRALNSRSIYDHLNNPIIDTTELTIEETVNKVIEIVNKY